MRPSLMMGVNEINADPTHQSRHPSEGWEPYPPEFEPKIRWLWAPAFAGATMEADQQRGFLLENSMNPMHPSRGSGPGAEIDRKIRNFMRRQGVFDEGAGPAITRPMKKLNDKLNKALAARKSAGLLRQLRQDADGVDFSSNDYLGLSRSEELRRRIDARSEALGTPLGSTGSRLISGNSAAVETLESQIAAFHRADAALLFGSGYAANTGVFSCLLGAGDTLVMDELIHASMIDGARLSKADRIVFKHNDLGSLKQALQQAQGNKVIGIESVYSMDGDVAPLKEIAALAEEFDAAIVIDEAHSTGIMGPQGRGLVVGEGLEDRVFARVHTFGKGLGLHGAAVVGSKTLRDYLINFARPFIFATAPTPHTVASIAAAYDLLPEIEDARQNLFRLIDAFRERTRGQEQRWIDSRTWVQALIVPGNEKVRAAAQQLRNRGFWTVPIVSPTVPAGKERIRICLHAFNTVEEIHRLFASLDEILMSEDLRQVP